MKFLTAIRAFPLILLFSHQAVAQSISGVVNNYYHVSAVNTVANTLTLNTTAGLSAGTKVLVIQMKGATINATNASAFGDITAINNAGNYEFNYICSIVGNDVFLQYQLLNTYSVANAVQLVSIPVYASVTIAGPLTAATWDAVSGTGGIVAIEATNTIFVNSTIDVSGLGFAGGALQNYPAPPYDCTWAVTVDNYFLSLPPSDSYHTGGKKGEGITDYPVGKEYGKGKLSNGGGGGNNTNTGGAGGGNFGVGGDGGVRTNESFFQCHGGNPGIGGLSLAAYGYTTAQNRVFFGGGGGSGHENNGVGLPGGNGGGMIFLTAALITGTGQSILANGLSPTNPAIPLADDPSTAQGDGGGGGGAGGTIVLNSPVITGSLNAQANGARGSDASNKVSDCTGPGGGGGAGVIWVAAGSFPATVTGSVAGGAHGVVSSGSSIAACVGSANGATTGANGNKQTSYLAPLGTAEVCAVLGASALEYFRGSIAGETTLLSWGLNRVDDLGGYELESSVDRMHYEVFSQIANNGEYQFTIPDNRPWAGTNYYRLKLIGKNGRISYSAILAITRNKEDIFELLALHPNPASDLINLSVFAKKTAQARIVVYNAFGQIVKKGTQEIVAGYSGFNLSVADLAAGTYWLSIEWNGNRTVKSFVKIR